MKKEIIEKMSNEELIDMMNLSRSFENKKDENYDKLYETLEIFHESYNIKDFAGVYIPQMKRQIHREIEKRFKNLINYKENITQ